MMIIRSSAGFIPGGFLYEDPRTPSAVWNESHFTLDDVAARVQTFRLANPKVYPEPQWTDYAFIRQQVVDFNCRRIGFDPNYCMEFNKTKPSAPVPASDRKCPKCQIVLEPTFCPTCSGRRITGYHCPSCKIEYTK